MNIEKIKQEIKYDPETGLFYKGGEIIGRKNKRGYVEVSIGRAKCRAHRIAWLLFHGLEPHGDIDHINGVRSDNRICNLRCVTRCQNLQNQRKAHKDSAMGLLGVRKEGHKFGALIMTNGKRRWLGSYPTPEQAHEAYLQAKRQEHSTCTI